MKCPVCWTEKAYLRQVKGWAKWGLRCLLLRPMKCHHCYHKFVAFWPLTIGQRVTPPTLKIYPGPADPTPVFAPRVDQDEMSEATMKIPRRVNAA